jgi:hypothetical protein
MHLRMQASAPGVSQQLVDDVDSVAKTWAAIRRRFCHRGVRMPRQLLLGSSFGLVQESMRKKPAWLGPFRRPLRVVDCKRLFPSPDRGEGVPDVAVHQASTSDVLRSLRQADMQIGPLFADNRWRLVRSSTPQRSWLNVLTKNGFPCSAQAPHSS